MRNKALAADATTWLDTLPEQVAELERKWSIRVGRPYTGGTEAFVAEATLEDGSAAVLKLLIPRPGNANKNEIQVLRLADGDGCARLLRHDLGRSALLLERLGASLFELAPPLPTRQEILCTAAQRIWRPAHDCGLPTGAEKGQRLIEFIGNQWEKLDRPCSERTVDYALECASRRVAAHDDERAVLVHGDIHQWNALQSGSEFKLVDPDGLLAEAEYDMGILMREDPDEDDPKERARWLANRTGLDVTAIWEWGVAERVSTGLLCSEIDLQPVGRDMLRVAEQVSMNRL